MSYKLQFIQLFTQVCC